MRASDTGLQSHIAAVGTWQQNALRTGEDVDYQANEVQEEDQQHPKDRVVHASGLGVASYPNEQDDADDQKKNGNENQPPTTTTAGRTPTSRVARAVLRATDSRSEQRKSSEQSGKLIPSFHSRQTFQDEMN